MENTELDLLLSRNRLFFHWSEVASTWRLSPQKKIGENLAESQSYQATNLNAAKAAAVLLLKALPQLDYYQLEEKPLLDALLYKYRLTFNWANPGLKWWLVGQNKGSNALRRTVPQSAIDIETAKKDAVQYILAMYESSPKDIEG